MDKMIKRILMKLYTVVVYDLKMCIKEKNHGRKNTRKITQGR